MASEVVNSAWESQEGEYLLWDSHEQLDSDILAQVNERLVCQKGASFSGFEVHFMTPCNTRSVAIAQSCLQSLHCRPLLTTVCGPSCSCWFISNTTPILPVLQLPSHFQPTVTKSSASSLCPVPCLSTYFCSGIFTKFCLCHSPLHCCLAFVGLGTPKGICSQSGSGVPHYRLQYPQILHQFLIPASKSANRCAFGFLALSRSLRNTALG